MRYLEILILHKVSKNIDFYDLEAKNDKKLNSMRVK